MTATDTEMAEQGATMLEAVGQRAIASAIRRLAVKQTREAAYAPVRAANAAVKVARAAHDAALEAWRTMPWNDPRKPAALASVRDTQSALERAHADSAHALAEYRGAAR